MPSIVYLFMDISLELTLKAPILSTSWACDILVLDTGKVGTMYGNCLQCKMQAMRKKTNF